VTPTCKFSKLEDTIGENVNTRAKSGGKTPRGATVAAQLRAPLPWLMSFFAAIDSV